MTRTYISIDVEASGPYPGDYDLLQIGAAAFDESGQLLNSTGVYLKPLSQKGIRWNKDTLYWWAQQDAFLDLLTMVHLGQTPSNAMAELTSWIDALPGAKVCICAPASWDFMWLYYYFMKFLGRSPFKHRALDLRSFDMGKSGVGFFEAGKARLPRQEHNHDAVSDAIEQGRLFFMSRDGVGEAA